MPAFRLAWTKNILKTTFLLKSRRILNICMQDCIMLLIQIQTSDVTHRLVLLKPCFVRPTMTTLNKFIHHSMDIDSSLLK